MASNLEVAVLIDELKNEDVQARLNSMGKLESIANALGPQRTRDELLPFLLDCVDDEDEVTVAMATCLGLLVDAVGGPDHAECLLPLLEQLCNTEEAIVRNKAVESLLMVLSRVADTKVPAFETLAKKLGSADWFTARSSACGLLSSVYLRVGDASKKELTELFFKLGHDTTPMVRRAVASRLGAWKMANGTLVKGFAEILDHTQIMENMVPLFINLSKDHQDSVRLLAAESAATLAALLPAEEKKTRLLPTLRTLFTDQSWRVRYMVADHMTKLQKALGPDLAKAELITMYVKLLADNEAEVRTAASHAIPDFCSALAEDVRSKTTLDLVLPCCKQLVSDSNQHVRAALAANIMGLAPVLGKQGTIEQLLPMFLQLLKDEVPEVRLNIISKLDCVNDVIGTDLLSQSLLPAIVELAEDRQWRVRLAIIKYIPLLAQQLGKEFFNEQLNKLCMTWLVDCVFSIREAATENLQQLTETFGVDWAKEVIFPKVLSMCDHPNYLYRMTTLFSINVLAPVLGADVIISTVLPVTRKLVSDPVPNVRFNVAKTYEILLKELKERKDVHSQIATVLKELDKDSDRDVKYFAHRALVAVQH